MKPRSLLASLILVSMLSIALAACGETAAAPPASTTSTASGPTAVQVTLSDFKIQPSLTTFKAGVVYHFVVTNNGPSTHEFMAGPISAANASESERDEVKLFEIEEMEPGQTATQDYTFTQPYSAGTLEFSCHVAGHYEQGMRLDFTVVA
ncbi:MAG TPA: hypothetical protein VFU63_01765 [Ktedonobacterales bacterium]|nr:hypothetical protein [Ktedonobacterales bacterium]